VVKAGRIGHPWWRPEGVLEMRDRLSRCRPGTKLIFAACAGILISVLMICSAGAAVLWVPNGVGVCTDAAVQSEPVCAPDGSGGAIIAWTDERYSGMTGKDIYARRVDASGNRLWADDVDVCRATDTQDSPRIVADGSGGAIIAWADYRNGSNDIYAQRLDANGSVHTGWTSWGEEVCHYDAWTQADPELCSDQLGGAVVAWRDFRNGNNDIYAQLIDATGTRQWHNALDPSHDLDGMPVTVAALNQEGCRIAWTAGGAQPGPVIVWEDDRDSSTSNLDIYAQKLNPATGAGRWTADGEAVREDSGGAEANQSSPCVVSDGAAGAIFAWQDNTSGSYDIYAQRLGSTGARLWGGAGGLEVCDAANGQIEPSISGRSDGAYIAWHDMRDDLGDIYLSAVLSNGLISWTTCVCGASGTQELPQVALSTGNAAVVAWTHLPSTASDVHAQFVSSIGTTVLPDDGFAVCDASGAQSSVCLAADTTNPPIVTWADPRTDPDGDVYAQRVTSDAPTVTGMSPGSGLNTGSVSITNLGGTGFDMDGATVKLAKSGETDIAATSVAVASSSRITCTLNLAGAAPGAWDVTVTNSDTRSATLAGAFTVSSPVPTPTDTCYPTWYLAEGTTDWGFDTVINIQNPNSSSVTAEVDYQTKSGPKSRDDITLPANSQTVLDPRGDIGNTDFSTRVNCKEGKTICVDRRMTWTGTSALSPEGHSSVGVTAPATTWYLPEGSSKWGFECWLLIQNPNSSSVTCNITYMIEGGTARTVAKTVAAGTRATFNMKDDIGEQDASIKVASNLPVIPERAMYRNNRREGHDSIGTTAPALDYYLAEGTTNWGFTTYVLVQNPNSSPANVTMTYMTTAGAYVQPTFAMDANSRKTVRVNDVLPGMDLSTKVHADRPIIAERAMYWDNGTGEACHDSIGMDQAHGSFFLPDGRTSGGYETWTLVQNPNAVAVNVEVTYMTPGGTGNRTFTDTVNKYSRKTYYMADAGISGTASVKVTCKTAGRTIMCERAMYWNNRGAGTDTIGGCDD
jgi:hypothetical protein